MERVGAEVRLSLDRSRVRRRALLMLSSVGEAFPGQLARLARIPRFRLVGVMEGCLPEYAPRLSLVALGLASVRVSALGRVYEITPRGRRHARRLAARWRVVSGKVGALER